MNANYYIERPHYMETLDKTLEYWTVLLVIAIFLLYSILRLAQYLPDGEVEVLPAAKILANMRLQMAITIITVS
jgi:hypothetical protein